MVISFSDESIFSTEWEGEVDVSLVASFWRIIISLVFDSSWSLVLINSFSTLSKLYLKFSLSILEWMEAC